MATKFLQRTPNWALSSTVAPTSASSAALPSRCPRPAAAARSFSSCSPLQGRQTSPASGTRDTVQDETHTRPNIPMLQQPHCSVPQTRRGQHAAGTEPRRMTIYWIPTTMPVEGSGRSREHKQLLVLSPQRRMASKTFATFNSKSTGAAVWNFRGKRSPRSISWFCLYKDRKKAASSHCTLYY